MSASYWNLQFRVFFFAPWDRTSRNGDLFIWHQKKIVICFRCHVNPLQMINFITGYVEQIVRCEFAQKPGMRKLVSSDDPCLEPIINTCTSGEGLLLGGGSKVIYGHLSNEKNPGCLWYIGDSTTQLYGDYNKPL